MATRRQVPFYMNDVKRAVKGATMAGLSIARVEFSEGKIILVTGQPAAEPATPFDAWKAKRDARSA